MFNHMKFKKISLFIILILFTLNSYSRDYIIVQSTTSIANTGLLDLLSSKFEKQTGIKVRPIAVGTVMPFQMLNEETVTC